MKKFGLVLAGLAVGLLPVTAHAKAPKEKSPPKDPIEFLSYPSTTARYKHCTIIYDGVTKKEGRDLVAVHYVNHPECEEKKALYQTIFDSYDGKLYLRIWLHFPPDNPQKGLYGRMQEKADQISKALGKPTQITVYDADTRELIGKTDKI